MKRWNSVSMVVLLLALMMTLDSGQGQPQRVMAAPGDNLVADGGFELGTPNAAWDETSTNFGTPICSIALCGDGGGTAAPYSGTYWAWFGGIAAVEDASVTQDIWMPKGARTLSFHLWIGTVSGTGNDYVAVSIDGNELFRATEAQQSSYITYTEVLVDVGSYADNMTHTLSFDGSFSGGGTTNIHVDNVELAESTTVFLPLVAKNLGGPFPPLSPTLYSISDGGDGDYAVEWSSVTGATSYALQEGVGGCSGFVTIYTGPNTSHSISGKAEGTYCYRVTASNTYGTSAPSNTETVTVSSCPPLGDWSGTNNQGYDWEFNVVDTPGCKVDCLSFGYRVNCTYAIDTSQGTLCSSGGFIEKNQFELGSNQPLVVGTFSGNTASGTWTVSYSHPDAGYCYGTGTWNASYVGPTASHKARMAPRTEP